MLGFVLASTNFCYVFHRLRELVSVTAGRVKTPLLHPLKLTSSPTQSTCRSPVGAALTLWVYQLVTKDTYRKKTKKTLTSVHLLYLKS